MTGVEFDPEAVCDDCGCVGAYDLAGDFLCRTCVGDYTVDDDGGETQAEHQTRTYDD